MTLDGLNLIVNNQEAWLRMAMTERSFRQKVGMADASETEIESFIQSMLAGEKARTATNTSSNRGHEISDFVQVDSNSLQPRELKIGEIYKLVFPNGNNMIAELTNINHNSYTADDYIFMNYVGGERLESRHHNNGAGRLKSNEFPIPLTLLSSNKIFLMKKK